VRRIQGDRYAGEWPREPELIRATTKITKASATTMMMRASGTVRTVRNS
jgi:hypothetical protein